MQDRIVMVKHVHMMLTALQEHVLMEHVQLVQLELQDKTVMEIHVVQPVIVPLTLV
jgi:hypothetical protein